MELLIIGMAAFGLWCGWMQARANRDYDAAVAEKEDVEKYGHPGGWRLDDETGEIY